MMQMNFFSIRGGFNLRADPQVGCNIAHGLVNDNLLLNVWCVLFVIVCYLFSVTFKNKRYLLRWHPRHPPLQAAHRKEKRKKKRENLVRKLP